MEGDFSSDSFNIEKKGGGEVDYSFAVNGVIGVSGIDQFLQPGSGEGMFPDKPPIKARCKGLFYPVEYLRSLRRSEPLSDSPMIRKVQDRVR